MATPQRRSDLEFWNPVRELDNLSSRLSQLFESSFGDMPSFGGRSPAIDLEETEDAYIIEADAPGVKKDDINIELQDNELLIHGEYKDRERKGHLRRKERRTGQFNYRVTVPGKINPDSVEAKLEDGVLTLTMQKAEETKSRRIEISDK